MGPNCERFSRNHKANVWQCVDFRTWNNIVQWGFSSLRSKRHCCMRELRNAYTQNYLFTYLVHLYTVSLWVPGCVPGFCLIQMWPFLDKIHLHSCFLHQFRRITPKNLIHYQFRSNKQPSKCAAFIQEWKVILNYITGLIVRINNYKL